MSKNKNQNKKINRSQNDTLSEQQVKQVFDVVSSIYQGTGAWTPQTVSRALIDKTMNPLEAEESGISAALLRPKDNATKLIGYNEYFELTSMIYKRTLAYYANLLKYNLSITCINSNVNYGSKDYLSDYAIVRDFFYAFDLEEQFSMITRQILRQDTFIGIWRMDLNNKFIFQEFPQDFAILTGKWEYGNLVDIDMLYFMRPGVDINMYPSEFKEYLSRLYNGRNTYDPAKSVQLRDGSFAQYVQTDPELIWGFKFNQEVMARIPFLTPMFPDIVLQPLMRKLQKNANIAAAYKIVAGEIGIKKDGKGAVVPDSLAYNPTSLGKLLSVVKSAMVDVIQLVGAPLSDIEGISFDGRETENLYSGYNNTIAASAGNSRLIFSNEKGNTTESHLMMNMDENLLNPLYAQYESFLNFTVNRLTKKYKFKFKLNGFKNYLDEEKQRDTTLKFLEKGFVDLDSISHAMGLNNKFELEDKMKESKAFDLLDKLIILPNMYNQSSNSSDIGRPKGKEGSVSQNGTELNPDSNANKT